MAYYDLLVRTQGAKETAEELGLKTFPFVELQPSELAKAYDRDRLVFVRGGTLEQNRHIVRSPCDVLLDALNVDSGVVQVAKDNDVAFGVSFHQFLYSSKFSRVALLASYRRLFKLYAKMGAKIVLVSGASNNFEARPAHQLESLGIFLGQTKQQAKWSLTKVPEYLVSKKVTR